MKKILVSTDFSKTGNNAVKYAVNLARICNAEAVIYNVYDIYTPVTIYDTIPIPYIDYRKHSYNKLRNLQLRMKKLYPEVVVSIAHNEGEPLRQILAYTEKTRPDVLIVGANSANVVERLIGSTTSGLISKSEIPILAIPAGVRFKPLKKILFAYDLEKISSGTKEWLGKLSSIYSCGIDVLSLVENMDFFEVRMEEEENKIIKALEGINPEIYFAEAKDFSYGIETFAKKHKAGLLVTQHRNHNFLYRLMEGSTTKSLSFELQVPMMSIPADYKLLKENKDIISKKVSVTV